jgi:peptidoglycan/xylan/chitin deacetylase (PgdA/CDA1 family)
MARVAPQQKVSQSDKQFWPADARLCVSIAMQFEAGGQPISGAGGPITEAITPGYPDLGTNSFFDYGIQEGVPRMLDLFDMHGIKVTSFMIGEAIERHPELAREIVRRGHEPAAHGKRWEPQYTFSPEEERAWIQSSIDSIVTVTGQRPSGYDCYWMRGSVRTLSILQELGFTYHNNDLSRDEPFIQEINGEPFVSVPYTIHMNDIVAYDFTGFSPADYEQQLRDEFDQLYEEGGARRRMMLISLHDRLSGHASRVRVLDRFLTYARSRPDVWFARKDEIARHALATPDITPLVVREVAEISGLAGNTNQRNG